MTLSIASPKPPVSLLAKTCAVRELDLRVKSNQPVNGQYFRLVLEAPPDLLAQCRAGQFFHLLCPPGAGVSPNEAAYLRRPMSIYGFFPDLGELHFLYKLAGSGTRGLATLQEGHTLNVVGPLGNGFEIRPDYQRLLLLARGVGLATLAPLALEAKRLGRQLTAICSARSPDLLMSLDYFSDLGVEVVAVTDSEGTSSVAALEAFIEARILGEGIDAFYTCGSNRLLMVLQRLGAKYAIAGEVALEQQMACGLGMCQCCVRPFTRQGKIENLRVCKDGPVFSVREAMAW